MTTNEHPHPSFRNGNIEKDQYESSGPDHDDHETSDVHSDHDGSSIEDHDDVEQGPSRLTQPITREKSRASRRSNDLRRSASNVLSAVISRVTTRGWPEPPPPPDGGRRAWLQVACVCTSPVEYIEIAQRWPGTNLSVGMVSVRDSFENSSFQLILTTCLFSPQRSTPRLGCGSSTNPIANLSGSLYSLLGATSTLLAASRPITNRRCLIQTLQSSHGSARCKFG